MAIIPILFITCSPKERSVSPVSSYRISSNGAVFLATWSDEDIFGRFISSEGDFLSDIFRISEGDDVQMGSYLSCTDSIFFVSWKKFITYDSVVVMGRTLQWNDYVDLGALIEFNSATDIGDVAGIKTSDGFVIYWKVLERYFNSTYIASFDLNGNLLNQKSLYYSGLHELQIVKHLDSDLFLLPTGNSAQLIDTELEVINSVALPESGDVSCAFSNDRWFITQSEDDTLYFHDIYGTIITELGEEISLRRSHISGEGTENYHTPAVAGGNDEFLVVWIHRTIDNGIFLSKIIQSNGWYDDTPPDTLFTKSHYGSRQIGYANGTYLMLIKIDQALFGYLLSESGELLQTNPIVISSQSSELTKMITALG